MTTIEPVEAQERAVRGLVAAGGTGLVSAGTGCGKTLMALWTIDRTARREGIEPEALSILVVAPLRTESGWRRAVGQVWPDDEVRFCVLSKKRKPEREALEALLNGERPRGVSFIGWELLASLSKTKRYDARAGKVKSMAAKTVLGDVERYAGGRSAREHLRGAEIPVAQEISGLHQVRTGILHERALLFRRAVLGDIWR